MFKVERFSANPLVHADHTPVLEGNVNGASVIEAPAWLPDRLGRYYMYFAHHQGRHIRLAYADCLDGPWQVYAPGTLRLAQTPCHHHIASPDVHVDAAGRQILMYFHGPVLKPDQFAADPLYLKFPYLGGQRSLLAVSANGIDFVSGNRILGPSYYRVFNWRGQRYAIAMPGILYRQVGNAWDDFEEGPHLFSEAHRHFAVLVGQDGPIVFFSKAGDCPERIQAALLITEGAWTEWQAGPEFEVIAPKAPYEGVDQDLEPSARGAIHGPARQLRDPCIFTGGDRTYLFYSVAGEMGIAGARLSATK
ncbi:MAG: hypothetical protein OXC13_05125 [Caldilineaceae bacterium]|nr:hypothetical protein [Caldilineaceae bacterium]